MVPLEMKVVRARPVDGVDVIVIDELSVLFVDAIGLLMTATSSLVGDQA